MRAGKLLEQVSPNADVRKVNATAPECRWGITCKLLCSGDIYL